MMPRIAAADMRRYGLRTVQNTVRASHVGLPAVKYTTIDSPTSLGSGSRSRRLPLRHRFQFRHGSFQ